MLGCTRNPETVKFDSKIQNRLHMEAEQVILFPTNLQSHQHTCTPHPYTQANRTEKNISLPVRTKNCWWVQILFRVCLFKTYKISFECSVPCGLLNARTPNPACMICRHNHGVCACALQDASPRGAGSTISVLGPHGLGSGEDFRQVESVCEKGPFFCARRSLWSEHQSPDA